MSLSTSSASASTSLTPSHSTNVVATGQLKTPTAKTATSKVKYPPAKTWAHNSKPTEVVDKPTHWTPGLFNPHRVPEDPKDGKVYVHIITHECLEGDAVRCVIKGVPEGSEVEANDYIRVGDIARLFLKQLEAPPAIGPNKTKTWGKPGGNWPTVKPSWNSTGEPSWSKTGVWSTKPVFLTASSSKMPDMIITIESNFNMSLPTSSSSSSYSSMSNRTVSLSTISSTDYSPSSTSSSSSSPTTSSSSLASSSLSMEPSSTSLTSSSLSIEPSSTSLISSSSSMNSSMSSATACSKCDTTTTVSTTTTAISIFLTTGPFNNGTTTTTVTTTIVSPSATASFSSSANGTSSGPTGTPTWSINTVLRSRPNTLTMASPSNGWPIRTETANPKKKYFTKDSKGRLHHNFFTKSATIMKRNNPEPTSTEKSWFHVMQKNFLADIAKLPDQAFGLVLKTHTKSAVEPTAADIDATSILVEDMETATPVEPTSASSLSPERAASLSAEIYTFMQTAIPLAEGEFLNPNNPSIKALTATTEAPKYTWTPPFPHGKIDPSEEEHGISRQTFVGIWSIVLVFSLIGMVGSGWVMIQRKRARKAAQEAEAVQKFGY